MKHSLSTHDLVLIGAGHTNAHILRMWRMAPIANVKLTLVSAFSTASYSGMLPGTLAGLYQTEQMQIDLHRLCNSCGARLIVDEITGLDSQKRRIKFAERPPLRYDVASLGIGSIPAGEAIWRERPNVLGIKPMQTFLDRLEAALEEFREREKTGESLRVAVVGAGAAGVEVAFCLDAYFRRQSKNVRLSLLDSGDSILEGYAAKTISLAQREFNKREISLILNSTVNDNNEGKLFLANDEPLDADLVVWAAGASPPPVLAGIDLPKADDGFLAVRSTLQSTGDERVFAVGDTATLVDQPVPKAGVYAVREGPVLWENINRLFRKQALIDYRPQRDFLSLLCTGEERAILQYKGRSFHGRWVWKWKDHIDRKFMRKYQDYRPMSAETVNENGSASHDLAPIMRCRGCGGKVGANVLSAALNRLEIPASDYTRNGLASADDAALLVPEAGPVDVISVDFFQPFLDDPYFVGRVAALNALSDLWAMGSKPIGAMAIVTLPAGEAKQQSELLYQLLAGGVHELMKAGATLLGGHTTESDELTIGYTVLGTLEGLPPWTKGNLQSGDRLILTKPLGTGVLLAAHALSACRAGWMDAMLASMLVSNASAARVAREVDVAAVTDVTGFGLAGHLLEMLDASGFDARVSPAALPLLDGFAELSLHGFRSSLDPANRELENRISSVAEIDRSRPEYAALFDPQTSGGLLIAASEDVADEVVSRLRAIGTGAPTIIGEIGDRSNSPTLTLLPA